MARVRQFYDDRGAPFAVPSSPGTLVAAWLSHRTRMTGWLRDLPESGWSAATRCSEWNVASLAQHLISGSQFLGYTLHQSKQGNASRLLVSFDAQTTAATTALDFAGLPPSELLDRLREMDARVAAVIDVASGDDWLAPAEAPPGRMPAYMSLNHFLFDSWVHERDLMIPAGDTPETDPNEAMCVASYVLAMAGAAGFVDEPTGPDLSIRVHLADLGKDIYVRRSGGETISSFEPLDTHAEVSAPALAVIDAATGRTASSDLDGDPAALDYIRHLAEVMA